MNNGPETIVDADGEGSVTVNRHFGVLLPGGVVRWDPGYGSGVYIPYSEAQARDDVTRTPGSKLVTRTETTLIVTTAWKEVQT